MIQKTELAARSTDSVISGNPVRVVGSQRSNTQRWICRRYGISAQRTGSLREVTKGPGFLAIVNSRMITAILIKIGENNVSKKRVRMIQHG